MAEQIQWARDLKNVRKAGASRGASSNLKSNKKNNQRSGVKDLGDKREEKGFNQSRGFKDDFGNNSLENLSDQDKKRQLNRQKIKEQIPGEQKLMPSVVDKVKKVKSKPGDKIKELRSGVGQEINPDLVPDNTITRAMAKLAENSAQMATAQILRIAWESTVVFPIGTILGVAYIIIHGIMKYYFPSDMINNLFCRYGEEWLAVISNKFGKIFQDKGIAVVNQKTGKYEMREKLNPLKSFSKNKIMDATLESLERLELGIMTFVLLILLFAAMLFIAFVYFIVSGEFANLIV